MSTPSAGGVITPGPEADLIDHAARVIIAERRKPYTAPYHWAGALYREGMLCPPGTTPAAEPVDPARQVADRDHLTRVGLVGVDLALDDA